MIKNVKMVTFPKALEMSEHTTTSLEKRIIIFVGGYGSGKTEVAVNYTAKMAKSGYSPLCIVDLDIVNPYFRSREAALPLTTLGVNVIMPTGEQCSADLPIIRPEIKGAIQSTEGYVILDVGGDDVGARVLSSMVDSFRSDEYEMLMVLNGNRPFTSDVEKSIKMIKEIQNTSRLRFTGIVSNTHLIDETTKETVLDGLKLAKATGEAMKLPVRFVSAKTELFDEIQPDEINCDILPLSRFMLKPWEIQSGSGRN
jgi:hypothetical protein